MTSKTQPRHVIKIGRLSEIPIGEGRAYSFGGREIAVFRLRDGRVFATQARCPHRGGPLADGLIGDGTLICPLHAFAFDLASGGAMREECPALETYQTIVTGEHEIFLLLPHHHARMVS